MLNIFNLSMFHFCLWNKNVKNVRSGWNLEAQCQCWWWGPAPALHGHLALARQEDSLWNLTLVLVKWE